MPSDGSGGRGYVRLGLPWILSGCVIMAYWGPLERLGAPNPPVLSKRIATRIGSESRGWNARWAATRAAELFAKLVAWCVARCAAKRVRTVDHRLCKVGSWVVRIQKLYEFSFVDAYDAADNAHSLPLCQASLGCLDKTGYQFCTTLPKQGNDRKQKWLETGILSNDTYLDVH